MKEFLIAFSLGAAGGYAAAVFTWEPVHTWLVGVETKVASLQARIRALRGNP